MCLTVVFSASYKEPAHATTAVVIGGAALVAAAATALGIGVAASVSNTSYSDMCGKVWDSISQGAKDTVVQAGLLGTSAATVGTPFLMEVNNKIIQLMGRSTFSSSLPNGAMLNTAFDGFSLATFLGFGTGVHVKGIDGLMTTDIAGNQFEIFSKYNFSKDMARIDTILNGTTYSAYTAYSTGQYRFWSPHLYGSSGGWCIENYPVNQLFSMYLTQYVYSNFLYTAWIQTTVSASDAMRVSAVVVDKVPLVDGLGKDLIDIRSDQFYAQGLSALNNAWNTWVDKAKARLGIGNDVWPLNIPSADVNTDTRRQTQATTLPKAIEDETDTANNTNTNTGKDTSTPKPLDFPDISLPQILLKKFPFCLPWDFYNAIVTLSGSGAPPKWDLPFKIQSLNINEIITIDFSQFETLAAIMRWGLSLMFIVILIFATRKLMWR